MSAFANTPIRYSRSQRRGIILFIFLFLLLQAGFLLLDRNPDNYEAEIPEHLATFMDSDPVNEAETKAEYSEIDVNGLDREGWMDLGFSERQAGTILKYRYSLGGYFENTEQIKACYVISEKKFRELEPHILIRIPQQSPAKSGESSYRRSEKPEIVYSVFDPNDYNSADWQRIGFSERQSATILKYKRSLGGSFSTLEEIEASFVISSEKFREMKPYIVFNKEKEIKTEPALVEAETEPARTEYEVFNPNDLDKEDWVMIGFTEKQVQTILNYKRSLGGRFPDAETLKKCYVISEQKFSELEPYLVFD